MHRYFFLFTLILLTASMHVIGAFAVSEKECLTQDSLIPVTLNGTDIELSFTPPVNSSYSVYCFPAEPNALPVSCELLESDARVAYGRGLISVCGERLAAGTEYTVRISGSGSYYLEIARDALSRCFAQPMELTVSQPYTKVIARAHDAHWYAFSTQKGSNLHLTARALKGEARLTGTLFDEHGIPLHSLYETDGGAALLDFAADTNQTFYLRICAKNGKTGSYELNLSDNGENLPELLTLSDESVSLEGHSKQTLAARFYPEGSSASLYWESADPSIAHVSQDGTVSGREPGGTVITAYAPGGLRAECAVQVNRVWVSGLSVSQNALELYPGDEAEIHASVLPENATNSHIYYTVEPEGVAELYEGHRIRALREGKATVTAASADGDYTAQIEISVVHAPPRCHALLIGEQNYASGVRTGSLNSVNALNALLSSRGCSVTTVLDPSRDSVIDSIHEAYKYASESDTCIFYITCHGDYSCGTTRMVLFDGSVLTAVELEQALRRIPGKIIVLLDCCGSGGSLGVSADITTGFIQAFNDETPFSDSRYRVIASAAADQDSYRIAFSGEKSESAMATAFARALCDGAGWDILTGTAAPVRADTDENGILTFCEWAEYARRRALYLLREANPESFSIQNVLVWPEGCTDALFNPENQT